MKYLSFKIGDRESYGIVVDNGVADLGKKFGKEFPTLKSLAEADFPKQIVADKADYALEEITFLPPIAEPMHIWCLALNYVEHHNEVESAGRAQELPKQPALFMRARDTLVGHDQPLRHPGISEQYDFEAELTVVIGKPGFKITQDNALEHIAGYTIMNEGSVRDWQFHTRQITPGKNFLHSGSIGPWIVPRRDVPNVEELRIVTKLNGTTMQDDTAAHMVHKIPRFIEYASSIAPLYAGDILATGTPSGVGFSRKPPVFMKPGDVCEITIDRIGTLRNSVRQD